MGFFGRLEEMPLEDIVQILAMSRRTGKLVLTRGPAKAAIAFRDGDIVCAAFDGYREPLGQMLSSRGLVTEETLNQALTVQRRWMPWRFLGSLLVEMGAIRSEELDQVVRDQVEQILGELLAWDSGLFKFEALADEQDLTEEFGGVHLLFSEGVRTERTMLQAAQRLDERLRRGDDPPPPTESPSEDRRREAPTEQPPFASSEWNVAQIQTAEPALDELDANGARRESTASPEGEILRKLLELEHGPSDEAVDEQEGLRDPHEVAEIALVKSIMDEVRSPRFTGEISLMIMRYAAEMLRRGLLFALRGDSVAVLAEFGIEDGAEGTRKNTRGAKIPLTSAGALRTAIDSMRSERGGDFGEAGNGTLLEILGGSSPREFVTIPIIADGQVLAVLYGDNWPEDDGIGSIEGLELLMIHAGLCLEKNALEHQLQEK